MGLLSASANSALPLVFPIADIVVADSTYEQGVRRSAGKICEGGSVGRREMLEQGRYYILREEGYRPMIMHILMSGRCFTYPRSEQGHEDTFRVWSAWAYGI